MFKAVVCNLQPDIIGVTESWTNDKIFDSELHLDNYCIFRCDRCSGIRGGGVLLYVKESLHPVEFHTKTVYGEHVWCSIGDLLVGVCYRSTNLSVTGHDNEANLRKLLLEVSSKHVLILGDFNYPGVDWSSCSVTSNCNPGTAEFVQTIEDCFYTQHVLHPTRGDAILDLILSSDPDLVNNVCITANLGTSDHNMITFTVQHKHDVVTNDRVVRDYHKGDYDSMRNELKNVDWDQMLSSDIENSWSRFKHLLLELENKYIPVKKVHNCGRTKKPIWMSHKALKLVKKRTESTANTGIRITLLSRGLIKQQPWNFEKPNVNLKRSWQKILNLTRSRSMLIAELNLKPKHRLELCLPVMVLKWTMIKVLLNVLISILLQFLPGIICYLYLQFL